ncbi:MAG: hypothetical protein LBP34_00315 [Flavobacteriaceae bacterium]|jgi:hypothetical protein|nr:hypothetical protein [Flavobacteriaceae bacterium]
MDTTRRRFISTLLLSSAGLSFFFSLSAESLLFKILPKNSIDVPKKLKEAADYRKKNNLKASERIYKEIIAQKPDEIRAYDGLKKIILQKNNNDLKKVLDLYASGLNNNPKNTVFYERMATQYAAIAQGNKKLARQLGNPSDLLQKAISYLGKADNLTHKNVPLSAQYKKLQQRRSLGVASSNIRKNREFKQLKKQNKEEFRKKFLSREGARIERNLIRLTEKETDRRRSLRKLTHKDINTKRTKQISKLYVTSIKTLKKNKNVPQAIKRSKELYNFTQGSGNSLHMVKRLCKQFNRPEEAEAILRDNHQKQNTFWSGIALFDVLIAKHKKLQTPNLAEAEKLLNEAASKIKKPQEIFELETRKVIHNIYSGSSETYTNLMALGDTLVGISSTHTIDRFNSLCVLYYTSLKEKENAIKVIDIALNNDSSETEPYSIYEKVKMVNMNRDDTKPIHKEQLLKLRIKISNSI